MSQVTRQIVKVTVTLCAFMWEKLVKKKRDVTAWVGIHRISTEIYWTRVSSSREQALPVDKPSLHAVSLLQGLFLVHLEQPPSPFSPSPPGHQQMSLRNTTSGVVWELFQPTFYRSQASSQGTVFGYSNRLHNTGNECYATKLLIEAELDPIFLNELKSWSKACLSFFFLSVCFYSLWPCNELTFCTRLNSRVNSFVIQMINLLFNVHNLM